MDFRLWCAMYSTVLTAAQQKRKHGLLNKQVRIFALLRVEEAEGLFFFVKLLYRFGLFLILKIVCLDLNKEVSFCRFCSYVCNSSRKSYTQCKD